MLKALKRFFDNEKIEYFGVASIDDCEILRPYLLDRISGFSPKSVICYAVPYFSQKGVNISSYAVARDYHKYMADINARLCEYLKKLNADIRAYGFADHSPVKEVSLALKCGLGVLGENGLLITEKYSSFVFIGEVFADISPELLGYSAAENVKYCFGCGNCRVCCPTKAIDGCGECLSDVTQKKGELSGSEKDFVIKNKTAWGCDACQNVCPHTDLAIRNKTIYSPIEYFNNDLVIEPSLELIDAMPEEEFATRAYAWRNRETIRRNLLLLSGAHNDKKRKGTIR